MTTRTTIEFERVIGIELKDGTAVIETVNADVLIDGESVQIDLPAPGRWACDQEALHALIAFGNDDAGASG